MTVKLRTATWFFAAAVGVTLIGGVTVAQKKDDAKKDRGQVVKTIIKVDHAIQESFPPVLVVTATGQVPTGGWSDAKLKRRDYEKPPKDGIYEYDLTAVPPDGIATQVISKVTAKDSWKDPPKDMKGIKVYGVGDGVKTIKFDEKK
jgi:hypothetical protein